MRTGGSFIAGEATSEVDEALEAPLPQDTQPAPPPSGDAATTQPAKAGFFVPKDNAGATTEAQE